MCAAQRRGKVVYQRRRQNGDNTIACAAASLDGVGADALVKHGALA